MTDLSRFHEAQEGIYAGYDIALNEIKNGRKRNCWMWYIFPQHIGLGYTYTAKYYGLSGLAEAREYLADEILKSRLIEISGALLESEETDARKIMGTPDDLKLQSSMTLFKLAAPEEKVFSKVLDKFFEGKADPRTIELLEQNDGRDDT